MPPPAARPDAEPADPTSVAHFRILSRLGQGGMGVVYRAEDETLRRTVALKLLADTSRDEETRQRFLREARSAAAITHPNVAVVHQIGEADGRLYIAMELVEGESLRARLERGRLEPGAARELAVQIARGLAAAHDKGIVHRDLKPENVMITPDGVVKLLDFGLAKTGDPRFPSSRADVELAKTETLVTSNNERIMGTPAYMSPEQATGEPLDVRSDVFSFGTVLYEMLCGMRPFSGLSGGAMMAALLRDPPPPLRPRVPGLDEATEAVVLRCLAKAPAARFANAGEVLAALTGQSPRATTERSVAAPQASQGTTVREPRRSGGRVALLGVVSASIVGAAVWTIAHRGSPATGVVASASAPGSAAPPPRTSSPSRPWSERRLTSFPAEDYLHDAALTLDGKEFVFADDEGFWVQPVAGGARRPLGIDRVDGASEKTVSMLGDGKRVFVSQSDGEHLRAWIAPLDGSPARLVRDAPGVRAWASPDGSHLAVAVQERGDLQVVPVDGGPVANITSGSLYGACFSPDGTHLAFVSAAADLPSSITIAALDGSTLHRTYVDRALNMGGSTGIAWPERGRLLFTSHAPDGYAAVREIAVDADGNALGPPRELWRTRAGGLNGLSLAGDRASVIVMEKRDDVRVADLAPGGRRIVGAPRPFTRSEADCRNPAWLPDGRLSFFSDRDNQPALYVAPRGSTDSEAARSASRSTPETLLVPPVVDGAEGDTNEALRTGELVYRRPAPADGGDAGVSRVMTLTRAGTERELHRILAPDDTALVRCGGEDAGKCVLGVWQGHTMTLARVDLGTGKVAPAFFHSTEFHSSTRTDFTVSPDGAQVVITGCVPTLTVVDVSTGRVRAMTTTPSVRCLQEATFAPDGKTLFVTGIYLEAASYGILAVGLDGTGAMLLGTSNQWLNAPRVSPDGKRLAFRALTLDTDVWLLEPRAE